MQILKILYNIIYIILDFIILYEIIKLLLQCNVSVIYNNYII